MKKLIFLFFFTLLLISCEKLNKPTVTTAPVAELTWEYASAGGEVIDDGGSPVTSRGICITTIENNPPTIINSNSYDTWFTNDGIGTGNFTSTMNFKYAGAAHTIRQEHYFRAYATNKEGTSYGEVLSVLPHSYPPLFHSIKLVNLLSSSVTVNCVIMNPEDKPFGIEEFYFCYGPTPNPTIDGPHSIAQLDQQGLYVISDLSARTKYYLRGYIKNESGIVYSSEINFTTYDGILSDVNGNIYPFNTYGNQSWMTKNLKTANYNDGTIIPDVNGNWDWKILTSGATFHELYNFYAVADSRKLCPAGWHIPSDSEWKTFEMYLGMTQFQADNYDFRGTDEGGKLKLDNQDVTDPFAWIYPNLGATNSSGFSAETKGWLDPEGQYSGLGYKTAFWTSTESSSALAISRNLYYDHTQIARSTSDKKYGFSVRCLKD
jgi:uncharacterized protein (TIGR02145 family)